MNHPLISIIIPCYNSGEYIEETLESVYKLTYTHFEVIVIDDGSTDKKTLAILDKIESEYKLSIIRQDNAGPSVARNNAIKYATGKYFLPLDSDDLILPDALEKLVKAANQSPEASVIYANNQLFGVENRLVYQRVFDSNAILHHNYIALCCLIKKEDFEKAGGFDEEMSKKGLEDWELWVRFSKHGFKFVHINHTCFKIRVQKTSRTFEVANKNLMELRQYVMRKHSDLYISEFDRLYHEHKNIKKSIDFTIGNRVLYLPRKLKHIIKSLFLQ